MKKRNPVHGLTRRDALWLLAALQAGAAAHGETADFPHAHPLTLVVPYAPGGPTDAMARVLATALRNVIGQTMIVENKAGAGSNLGAEAVARADGDGYTLMLGTSAPLAINQFLYRKINYDPARSFAPVIQVGYLPNVLVVHPSVPANNVQELIAYARANKGKLSFASSGSGASSHLTGALFNMRAATDIQHIPYRGTGPALNDLLGGQVTMAFTDVLTALAHVQGGRLKVLGVTSLKRSRALPQTPTLDEQGLPGFDSTVFFGIVAPAATPEPIVRQINAAFYQVLHQPDVSDKLARQGLEPPSGYSPSDLEAYMKQEAQKWREVIRISGATAD